MGWFLGIGAIVAVGFIVWMVARRPAPGPGVPPSRLKRGEAPRAGAEGTTFTPATRATHFNDVVQAAALRSALKGMEWDGPTNAQVEILPRVRDHLDVVAAAPEGSGKTTGALLAAMERQVDREGLYTLVLCPDRAAVERAATTAKALASDTDLWVGAIHDEVPMQAQLRDLRAGFDVIVGTPGRIREHLDAGNLKLDTVEILVLDEADRMGGPAREPLDVVLKAVPAGRQTVILARDSGEEVRALAERCTRDPAWVYAGAGKPKAVAPRAGGGRGARAEGRKGSEDGQDHPRRGTGDRPVRTAGATGTVRWFNNSKGYGFITPDGSEEDIFVHYTAINEEGFKSLDEGDAVRFDIVDTKKGPEADNVRKK